jgi:hypothetical protein
MEKYNYFIFFLPHPKQWENIHIDKKKKEEETNL